MRKATLHRKTAETEIRISLTLDGRGKYEVSTGVRFLDHMLELFARHGGFDLKLKALGDLDVDPADSRGLAPAPPAARQAELDWARALCDAAMDGAARRGVRVAVAVVDRGGDPISRT